MSSMRFVQRHIMSPGSFQGSDSQLTTTAETPFMQECIDYLEGLVKRQGPLPHEYDQLNLCMQTIMESVRGGAFSREQLAEFWDQAGLAFTPETMQGFVTRKPHGYAGDFEIIDRIYTHYTSSLLPHWDHFFHAQAAPKAVCNRKAFLLGLLEDFLSAGGGYILNVASGPARDVLEFFQLHPEAAVHFDCVELDPRAIAFASQLNSAFLERINFHHVNAFFFKTDQRYNLVWSAGLFDYLSDKHFKKLLVRLFKLVASGGELVVGNFCISNSSRDYMEFGEWVLQHRSASTLLQLAMEAGMLEQDIRVESEPEGINLFLRVVKQ